MTVSSGSNASYYVFPRAAAEAIDLIEMYGASFSMGNILKSWIRIHAADESHSSEQRDLEKIIWSARRRLAQITDEDCDADDYDSAIYDIDPTSTPLTDLVSTEPDVGPLHTCGRCGNTIREDMLRGGTHCVVCGAHRTYQPL